jgi:hypothetical protein
MVRLWLLTVCGILFLRHFSVIDLCWFTVLRKHKASAGPDTTNKNLVWSWCDCKPVRAWSRVVKVVLKCYEVNRKSKAGLKSCICELKVKVMSQHVRMRTTVMCPALPM